MIISLSQVFSIPPYSDDIFAVYKSGYFSELEKEFKIIRDSYINIKIFGEPVYAWIFLSDISERHGIKIKVYDQIGYQVTAPGERTDKRNKQVAGILNTIKPDIYSEVREGKYFSIIPVFAENRCKFCHQNLSNKNVIGALSFESDYNAHVYYSAERIIIFLLITIGLGIMLFIILMWDPERKIKELFDKF